MPRRKDDLGFGPQKNAEPKPGPRMAALKHRKRVRLVKETSVAMAVGAILLIIVSALIWNAADNARDGGDDRINRTTSTEDPLNATLVVGTREAEDELVWLTLITTNEQDEKGSVIYIPAHTAAEVPGRGLQSMSDAYTSGNMATLMSTVENLLGIHIDQHLKLSDNAAQVLMEKTGTLSVDVPHEVSVKLGSSSARVIFDEGQQRLPAEFLVQLLYTVGLEGNDEELGGRHLAYWAALFETYAEQPGKLQAAFEAAGPSFAGDTDPEAIGEQMRDLVTMQGVDRSIALLPVIQVSVGGSEMYATEVNDLVAFLEVTVGHAARPPDQIEVQVLNGNGRPGVGEEVAERLIGHGFRVVLSSNAPNFDYEKTLIITYEDTEAGDAIAEQAKQLIGLGEVQISAQSQGIVDLTIVVGKDFLRTL